MLTSGEWQLNNSSLDFGTAGELQITPECTGEGGETILVPYDDLVLDVIMLDMSVNLHKQTLDIEIQTKEFDVTLGTNELDIDIINTQKDINNECQ